MRGKLDSQYLESFLTAEGTFPARIPYHGTITVDPSKFIVFISSNGFESTKDLTNRASIIRIRKRENYQYRTLDGKDLAQLMFLWQPILMGSVFAVVEEWHRRGKPKTSETHHDFREWCQALDWIVQHIFRAAPLMEGHEAAKQRAANPNLSFLRVVAIKLNERHRLDEQIRPVKLLRSAWQRTSRFLGWGGKPNRRTRTAANWQDHGRIVQGRRRSAF